MGFTIERSAGVSTVHIIDGLVAADRRELRFAMLGELADSVGMVRFDFAGASHIDAAGLGLLVSLSRLAREHGTELRLLHLDEELRTLFMLTKLDTMFEIERPDGEEDGGDAARPAPTSPRPTAPSRLGSEDRPRP